MVRKKRICTTCKIPRRRSSFYKHRRGSECKMCLREKQLSRFYKRKYEHIIAKEEIVLLKKSTTGGHTNISQRMVERIITHTDSEYIFAKSNLDEICSEFNCNKLLSITEKLCGDRCINHQIIKRKYGY